MIPDKLIALKDCLEHWEWLAKTGSSDKGKFLQGLPKLYNDCYACDFDAEMRRQHPMTPLCYYCPIDWEHNQTSYQRCYEEGTPFDNWSCAISREERIKYAKEMVELIKFSIEECC